MGIEDSVNTVEVRTLKGEGILRASAIGSCVAVAAYDPQSGVGGMAHVMLPGSSPQKDPSNRTKYAEDAVEEMMRKMAELGAGEAGIQVCLLGGGNVLGDGHDTPGPEIVESLRGILGRRGVTTVAMEVGGTQRRSCCLDVAGGRVTYTIGDSGQQILWENAGKEKA